VSLAIGPTWVGWSPLGYHNRPVFVFNSYFGGYGGGYYRHGGYDRHRGGWNVCSRDDFRSGVVTRAGYRRLEPDTVRASAGNARFVDEVSSLDRDLNPRTARLRETRGGVATSSSSRARGSEAALEGFRERGAVSSRQFIEDAQRFASPRGERPSRLSERVGRAREPQGSTQTREATRDAGPRSILRESRGLTERSRATVTPETSRPAETAERVPRAPSAFSDRRAREPQGSTERRETTRDTALRGSRGLTERSRATVTPETSRPAETAERVPRAPSAFSERRARFESLRSDSSESRGTRRGAPETRAPGARSESRSSGERAEPRRGRSMPTIESPSRETSRSARPSGERSRRSPSMTAPSSGGRGQGGSARGSSSRSGSPRGSARGRSNQS
jgi:hypothetical protein